MAIVLDIDEGVVRYGDPAGNEAPKELLGMIVWWLGQHGWLKEMKIEMLPCPDQGDSHSCSTLAFNSIVSCFYPLIPLVSSSPDGVPGRLQALELISIYIQNLIVSIMEMVVQFMILTLIIRLAQTAHKSETKHLKRVKDLPRQSQSSRH